MDINDAWNELDALEKTLGVLERLPAMVKSEAELKKMKARAEELWKIVAKGKVNRNATRI